MAECATRFDAYLFDLDGTIFIGGQLLPAVGETLTILQKRGKRVMFVTNTTIQTREQCASRLRAMGVDVSDDQIVTAAYTAALYFRDAAPSANVLLIGEEAMAEELDRLGVQQTLVPAEATHVLLGLDRTFTYAKLCDAINALLNGAKLIVANPDPACPVPGGAIPDTGALAKAIEAAAAQRRYAMTGKPSAFYAERVQQMLGIPGERCLVVGDRLETDILLGRNSRMMTALVLTGVTTREDLRQTDIVPDFILPTMAELPID
ncbi:HAD-IIA family hydrolase [Brevibacillus humidisoli]|uniref:HAD-IIA family hydrolase n=1 Tax=Brevibacillus humidisoli TaxID=2895522 RepID=UPI001E2E4B1E|nr:HAD-IIA family hydrolase [Brevibacillus humidisoli]UFJ40281.1 HAD-IIA family hydrolase [Brevibacillus humidisoli]